MRSFLPEGLLKVRAFLSLGVARASMPVDSHKSTRTSTLQASTSPVVLLREQSHERLVVALLTAPSRMATRMHSPILLIPSTLLSYLACFLSLRIARLF